ncbi:uncharacterized protein BXZ73DRAFT_41933 [Epithele typhae]|uniref:uncharacterized protein n=1 Tax=Epithele typhae TaxID=378194 RepID=UPI0020085D5B|nr:uncharacterized protein BXZ73DRAFT_41933 [Epithele typhae]KAH9941105.1 hypothetical protein BXZ73DRAFT_41933 [Epithele typhae]
MLLECTTCGRTLKNEAGLIQHCKDKGHAFPAPPGPRIAAPSPAVRVTVPILSSTGGRSSPFNTTARPAVSFPVPNSFRSATPSTAPKPAFECRPCALGFADKIAYDSHYANKHLTKPFKCVPCGVDFAASEALAAHLRAVSTHPKCATCGAAFVDQKQLDFHSVSHPLCDKCGVVVLGRLQLTEHYRQSPGHPSCFICAEGFVNLVECDEASGHVSKSHQDSYCRFCTRQFRLVEDLQNHYMTSPSHPHCALCEVGFADEDACDEVSNQLQVHPHRC